MWRRLRASARDSYWFLPACLIGGAGLLAFALIEVDQALEGGDRSVTFAGGPDSARAVLGAIAASMLSLTALVFSVTVVVLQLASSQFSPRVLRTFLRDRRNQVSLGVFAGTFVFGLLALRAVRGRDGLAGSFVPDVTVSVAVGLVLVSVALFVAYIHNITQSIRVVTIVDRITVETEVAIARLAADRDAASSSPSALGPASTICAPRRGVLVGVDQERLTRLAASCDGWIRLHHRIGTFVPAGVAVASMYGNVGEADLDEVVPSLLFANERTIDEDPAFGFRQLVDIAERALSPGVNDPSTAVQCLDAMHHLLRTLAARPCSPRHYDDDRGVLRLTIPVPSWPDYVSLALDEIRLWGAGSLQVHMRIRSLLDDLAETVTSPQHQAVIEEQGALLRETARQCLADHERAQLERRILIERSATS